MAKQIEQSDTQIKKIINFAEHLRSKIIIPSMELENFLNFQYTEILKKTFFQICTTQKISVSKAFKRAFRTMNRMEQANYYSKCVKIVLKQIYSTNHKGEDFEFAEEQTNIDIPQNSKRFEQLTILIKKEGSFKKWIICKVELASQICVLRIVQTGQQLDLNHYLMRESKSKNKSSLVLESTEQMAHPTTLRVSNYYESFQELKNKLQNLFDRALKIKIKNFLKRNRSSFSTSFRSSIQGEINMVGKEIRSKSMKKQKSKNENLPATILLSQGEDTKSMRRVILQCSKISFSEYECRKIYSKLTSHEKIFGLSSFKDFEQVSKDTFFNKKSNITRRIFKFDQNEMNYEWLVTSMNLYKTFKKWKPCLFLINLLAQFPEQRTKIYHEINLYKDYNQVDYVFLRHLFQIDGVNYYIDKSINTEEYGRATNNGSRGWIEECLWRFRKVGSIIEVLVQVEFGGDFYKKNAMQMAIQYIGEVGLLKHEYEQDKRMQSQTLKTVYNHNLFLFEDESEFNGTNSQIGSPFKKKVPSKLISKTDKKSQKVKNIQTNDKDQNKKQDKVEVQSSEIQFPSFLDQQRFQTIQYERQDQQKEENSFSETQFYSIEGSRMESSQQSQSDDEDSQINQFQQEQKKAKETQRFLSNLKINQSEISSIRKQSDNCMSLQNYVENSRYLFVIHPTSCKQKDKTSKPRQCTSQKGHFLWRKQWKITEKGQLININEQQIKVQSSVLKLVAKRMGRNLLSGKSVLNISLPIEIFGTDSNLERLCKSMAYGPRFLQDAVKLQSPAQRMKKTMCFALGYSLCYIEMQKPFNPILGQTYQGMIDGCPVYGQQISHHPPISTVLFKGRGYTVYANLQAKVEMGLNSASGINDGIIHVAFSQTDFTQDVIKFTCPPGQLSGLVMGDRRLTLTKKTYYVDEKNMILGFITWGSQKKKNQISFNNDYFEGQIVQLKPNADLSKLDKIKDTQFEKIYSQIKGRWTGQVWFNEEVLFDVGTDGPYNVEQENYPLQSNVHFRQDIILRKTNDLVAAQEAKEKLEELQREDRKLRKKYGNDH